ncbi:hypothetical protein GRI43_01515 [Altererythrobacter luteolus]|uniref:Sulfotransferase family protein n=1 Tax=Pontixanthobacter luteolus TaxID=295089 RepID=A0A6I4UW08_9SPHN|nr:sulfotransferase [Pontixanthobacter luteolus]MXP46069.1 hypothetical protein [Pontixanthobacter luteolus]
MSVELIERRRAAIRKHVFLLCPNNSGSTFLSKAIGTSPAVWSLAREGQHTFGYAGPSTIASPWPLIWYADEESTTYFRNHPEFDWERTKRAWYLQASAENDTAPVFMTKSPPFLLIADKLMANFASTSFLFMVRNPYAAMEGVLRRPRRTGDAGAGPDLPRIAAQHFVNCLRQQKANIAAYGDNSIAFTYEELCASPEKIAARIADLVPELAGIDLTQKLSVKQAYDEPLRNMNEQQIGRLTAEQIKVANEIFCPNADILSHFDYDLIE